MGQELLVGLGPQNISTPAAVEHGPRKVAWRPLPASPVDLTTAPATISPVVTGEIVDVTWSAAVAPDPEGVIATVRAERMASWGGHDHPHAESGCGYCRRAVAAYR